jgi:solute carrier family 35 protein C2
MNLSEDEPHPFAAMCKSSSLIFVLGFAFMFRLELFSYRLIGVISLIFLGVLLMVATETHFALGGFLMVTSASALSGLRWSLTQLLLRNKNMGMDNPPTTLFWLTPAMGVTLGIVSFVVESWTGVIKSEFFATVPTAFKTAFFLIAPGVVAFLMVVSEF